MQFSHSMKKTHIALAFHPSAGKKSVCWAIGFALIQTDFKIQKLLKLNIKILVAGTGTGQQSIGSAVTFSGSSVDAIDLSKSSLSYALRKSKELRVKNINFSGGSFEIDFLERSMT